jgi:hypothetical protein
MLWILRARSVWKSFPFGHPVRPASRKRKPLTVRVALEKLEDRVTPSNLVTLASFDRDSADPSSLILDGSGNLYGTFSAEGANGYGMVFEVAK